MFTVFIYADVADAHTGKVATGTCIQQFQAVGQALVDAISEGEEHAYALSDLYDHVEFAVWNEKARTVDFRGRPNRLVGYRRV
jgi:hypothetical protein